MPDDAKPGKSPPSKAASEPLAALPLGLLEENQHAFARWLEGMFAVAQEITQFTQLRLQEDMAAWSTLAACSSPEQAFDCQRRFAAKASEQYAGEIAKLSQMMVQIASKGMTSLQNQGAKASATKS